MTEYVITPLSGDPIIYGVLDADHPQHAGMTVLKAVTRDADLASQIFFYKALDEACKVDTIVEESLSLAGRGWFELAPVEPLPGGEPGGDKQVGEALSRRFVMKRNDGCWAVVTRYVYLAVPQDEPEDSDARVIETMDEFIVCKDLHDVGGTELFCDERYSGLPYEPTAWIVRREAFLLLATDITWNGEAFDSWSRELVLR